MKCPVCSSEVKELYNLNSEADEFKCFGCHLRDLDRRVRRLERQENNKRITNSNEQKTGRNDDL